LLKSLDSGFRRNDRKDQFLTFYEFINHGEAKNEKTIFNRRGGSGTICCNSFAHMSTGQGGGMTGGG
jgi:hypothetical protein